VFVRDGVTVGVTVTERLSTNEREPPSWPTGTFSKISPYFGPNEM